MTAQIRQTGMPPEEILFARMLRDAKGIKSRAKSDREHHQQMMTAGAARIYETLSGEWQPTKVIAKRLGAVHHNVLATLYVMEGRGMVEGRKFRGSRAKFWRRVSDGH